MSAPVCPYCRSLAEKRAVIYSASPHQFLFCAECGVVFKELVSPAHTDMTEHVYSFASFGKDFENHLTLHGPRIAHILQCLDQRRRLNPGDRHLDVGAGSGVLEQKLFDLWGASASTVTAMEPVAEMATWLKSKFPSVEVLCTDLESLTHDLTPQAFATVFWVGVDYLFRDIESALRIARRLLVPSGRMVIARAVFLNMPSYYKGRPILTLSDLIDPNPLISAFMYPEQYAELVARHFEIDARFWLAERYNIDRLPTNPKAAPGRVETRTQVLDCSVPATGERPPAPILLPESTLNRLSILGARVE